MRRSLWRAGHAHAGVWIILALVVLLYVDQVLSGTAATIARFSVVLAPILGPLGFFLSTTRPDAEKPNGLINVVYIAPSSSLSECSSSASRSWSGNRETPSSAGNDFSGAAHRPRASEPLDPWPHDGQ